MNLEYEEKFWSEGKKVCGVDEVGRGCLAGPVVAAAVVFEPNHKPITGITDSKKLSASKREKLDRIIREQALCYSVQYVSALQIDEINILQASVLAMQLAIESLTEIPDHCLIDGNYFRFEKVPFTTIIKGDANCYSIACASIIAKVERDKYMSKVLDSKYPHYGFAQHKGYATKRHREAILTEGVIPEVHRKTFLKNTLSIFD